MERTSESLIHWSLPNLTKIDIPGDSCRHVTVVTRLLKGLNCPGHMSHVHMPYTIIKMLGAGFVGVTVWHWLHTIHMRKHIQICIDPCCFHITLNRVFDALLCCFAASNMAATPQILQFVYKVFTSNFWSNYPLVMKCKLQAISMISTWHRPIHSKSYEFLHQMLQ
jgi:hypothetical protein